MKFHLAILLLPFTHAGGQITDSAINRAVDRDAPAMIDLRHQVHQRWSKGKTLFGSDHGSGRDDDWLDPRCDNAKIRTFFVHPGSARRSVGSRILEACENAAIEVGFRGFDLGATVTGERLYRARGYEVIERIEVPLSNGASLPVIRMSKVISR